MIPARNTGRSAEQVKKIGMVSFRYHVFSPLLINSIIMLAHEGYEIHVFIDKETYEASKFDFEEHNVIIHRIDITQIHRTAANPPHLWDKVAYAFSSDGRFHRLQLSTSPLATLYWQLVDIRFHFFYNRGPFIKRLYRNTRVFFPDLFDFYQKVANYIDNRYVCLFGIDWLGLIVSTMIAQDMSSQQKPLLIYYSLELLFDKRNAPINYRILKSLERGSNNLCDITIIQDRNRAQYLLSENNISEDSIIYVPVSGLGAPYRARGNYIREKLGVDESQKIMLSAGTIEAGMMSLELAEAAQKWNRDLALVLHSSRSDVNVEYVNKIKSVSKHNNVYLSLDPIPWQELPQLLSSADIGLAFYLNTGPNMYEIGSASNKLVQYLQVGLPIIASDFPSLKAVLQEYKCGECARHPREIETLTRKILANYDSYRENAFRCYEEKYNFARYFEKVVRRIKKFEAAKLPHNRNN